MSKPISFDPSRKWFDLRNVTADSADIFIYDEVGSYGVSASDVIGQLQALKVGTLNVHINSPGGSVFDGFAIYNALNAHPASIIVHIDGLAASIASVIAMAGDEIRMAENAMLMVHPPSCGVMGFAKDLRSQADVLDQLEQNIAKVYSARTGMTMEATLAAMSAETWYTASQCFENKLCTLVIAAKKIAAHFDLSAFRNAPAPLPSPESSKTPPLSIFLLRQSLLESQH